MRRIVPIITLLITLFTFSAGNSLATVMLNFNPGNTSVNVGSTFTVDLTADVVADEALVGWGFDLLYDPTQLSLNSASTSSYWDLMTFGPNNLTALLLADLSSPDPGLSGTGLLLASLNFTCLGPGISSLDISVNGQDLNQGFMTYDGQYAEWQIVPGMVEQVVPEPGTILLLGSGLAGIAWFSRRKRTS